MELAKTTGDYELDRQRHVKAMLAGLPAAIEMVGASRARIEAVQQESLRAMLAHAKANSAWHGKRLANIDVAAIAPATIAQIPPMTKADLMANWDAIVCDPRLSLDLANKHVTRISKQGPAYLLDEYHAVATGGSSGHRAVIVWDFDGFRATAGLLAARAIWLAMNGYKMALPPYWTANLASANPIHIGGAMTACFSNEPVQRFQSFPATLPIKEIIRRLKSCDTQGLPVVINAFSSILNLIARAKLAGELDISPACVNVGGEPLLPQDAATIRAAFGDNLINIWGASEIGGLVASNMPGRDDLILNDHVVLVEPVDDKGRKVAFGAHASKILVTNLVNKVLPLIRYEITDEMVLAGPDPALRWQGTRIMEIIGRTTDLFQYTDGAVINPFVFFSVLLKFPMIDEYQIRQTPRGAHARIVATAALDIDELARALEAGLGNAGVTSPQVSVELVSGISRHAESGKLKRFVPLTQG